MSDKYEAAIERVRAVGYVSISHVQRSVGVSYTEAAKMIAQMEQDGIVGPLERGNIRQILRPA